jgi:hypothetical protein
MKESHIFRKKYLSNKKLMRRKSERLNLKSKIRLLKRSQSLRNQEILVAKLLKKRRKRCLSGRPMLPLMRTRFKVNSISRRKLLLNRSNWSTRRSSLEQQLKKRLLR